jgi:hypothetical protein
VLPSPSFEAITFATPLTVEPSEELASATVLPSAPLAACTTPAAGLVGVEPHDEPQPPVGVVGWLGGETLVDCDDPVPTERVLTETCVGAPFEWPAPA